MWWRIQRFIARFAPRLSAVLSLHDNRSRLRTLLSRTFGPVPLAEDGPLPPSDLIAATALMDKSDLKFKALAVTYFGQGYAGTYSILRDVQAAGLDLGSIRIAFELGCGTARLIRHLRALPDARLLASDARSDTIEWCKSSVTGIEFHTNSLQPPLTFLADAEVDLAFAQSVFTHIPLEWQDAWLQEIARVLRPGGFLWCTVTGQNHVNRMLDEQSRQILEQTGKLSWTAAILFPPTRHV